ncbi:TM2 domain-containing protein [Acidicapsa ligni]|uniref:TM2 domain-containing protein n=1 Tax=Acidicapsa ligni TaxID=542300 RepID=UPI0021E0F64D|nr:TM2 domain-containing protein [Acidicapsa ligni]
MSAYSYPDSYPSPSPQQVFQMQFESVRRDEVVGVLLAIFLGCFGIHHFYVGRVGLGILYCCFCWTGIPALLGLVECFFMPGRVRAYNAQQAAGIAAALGIAIPFPGWGGYGYAAQPVYVSVSAAANGEAALVACGNCRQVNAVGSRFCGGCGARL